MPDPSTRNLINLLLDDAERVTGLVITVHDRTDAFREIGFGKRYGHVHPFCQAGRGVHPKFDERCQAHCRYAMNERAVGERNHFVHSCWKGGAEACAPVFRDGVHLLTLFGGILQAAEQPPTGLEPVALRAWRTLPKADPHRLLAVARILEAVGQGLLALLDEDRRRGAGSRRAVIERFIAAELHGPVSIAALGRHLELSPSRAAHVVTEQFAKPFGALVQERRLAHAKHLLLTTDETVGRIAQRCGFISQHWFSRLFQRELRESPGRWRRLHRPQA